MTNNKITPGYIFETSWEVCNKVGGIYTVLSTRAKTLQDQFKDKVIFLGPDFWQEKQNPLFKESKTLLKGWREHAASEGLDIRVGRWQIPGKPIAVLVDFKPFLEIRNDVFGWAWQNYKIDSLHAYGDYDESLMFSWAAGKVIESYYKFFKLTKDDNVIFQAHEWQTGLAALYINKFVPEIATIFTTHATTIGRSIAGNNKPLYDYLQAYNGSQMAFELNVEAKHSVEKQTAHFVDCFTTVSEITGTECEELLDKTPDVILMNGFEDNFVPSPAKAFDKARKEARKTLLNVANTLMGTNLGDDTIIVSTGGRYEYKNKGIDVFVDAMNRLRWDETLNKNVLAFVLVPAWVKDAREDLKSALEQKQVASVATEQGPVGDSRITHELYEPWNDKVMSQLNWLNVHNIDEDKVKIVFVPCYLDGADGIFNKHYYEIIIGCDINVYPSYYEPWGYTPTESVAFHVPCITTDLAGFGLWANSIKGCYSEIEDGVKTIHRSDYNFDEVSNTIKNTVLKFCNFNVEQVAEARNAAKELAEKALWKHFIIYYYEAYDKALANRDKRLN